jgi:glycosyltransferase involved in cell wall biosynthesis
MRIAFYAPLKAPDHPTPSGDRRIGRLLMDALRLAGHDVFLASRFRSRDDGARPGRAARLAAIGARLAARLGDRMTGSPPDLWFTYHLYYKAPDYLGPALARRFGVPYVVAEASIAGKRRGLPGHDAALAALGAADLAVSLNPADLEGVQPHLKPDARSLALAPFLEAEPPMSERPERAAPILLAVAMMRPGDKLASYRLLAEALSEVIDRDWTLMIAGDGPARGEVEAAFARFGERVTFLGLCDAARLARLYGEADLLVWPAINEAFGMALLEAQAAGLPVIAGDCGGVGAIVRDGLTGLTPPVGDVFAFADRLRLMLDRPSLRRSFGRAAREAVRAEHLIGTAAARLNAALAALR